MRRWAKAVLLVWFSASAALAEDTKSAPSSAGSSPATPTAPVTSTPAATTAASATNSDGAAPDSTPAPGPGGIERTEAIPGLAADDEQMLEQSSEPSAPSSTVPAAGATRRRIPRPVLDLEGYFRVRGEWQKRFFLNRNDRLPFTRFVPGDRDAQCTEPTGVQNCGSGKGVLGFANMRFRVDPTFSITDDIQLHARFDVFDNYVLGSSPQAAAIPPNDTTDRGNGLSNNPKDTIRVRRVWAEVTNRSIGQLRFGRMPNQWGLGMVYNGGDGIDGDYESDIDRIQAITRYHGIHLGVSWDFPSSGAIFDPTSENTGIPFDLAQKDDVKQWSFLLVYKRDDDDRDFRLKSGKWVTEGGMYFVLRNQKLSSSNTSLMTPPDNTNLDFFRRDAKVFVPDLWFSARRDNLRFEVEFAYVAGRVQSIAQMANPGPNEVGRFHLRQIGIASETEFRPKKAMDKLGVFFNTGLASGDAQSNGLSAYENTLDQGTSGNKTLSHFAFNPNYRVDLILFRNLLGQIGGAWYLAPGVSYDILHNAFGQKLGGRFDAIYSRAVKTAQTYGGNPNLGTELDFSVYYQSEGGSSAFDGYYIQAQYGVLFAMKGLQFRPGDPNKINTSDAQTMRILMGVRF